MRIDLDNLECLRDKDLRDRPTSYMVRLSELDASTASVKALSGAFLRAFAGNLDLKVTHHYGELFKGFNVVFDPREGAEVLAALSDLEGVGLITAGKRLKVKPFKQEIKAQRILEMRDEPGSGNDSSTGEKGSVGMPNNWGLDRISHPALPLNTQTTYSPDFTGQGVTVFVVDTGIDTTHIEFQGNKKREVKNVWEVRSFEGVDEAKKPAKNNDIVGHGTHVAGIVGGKNVGVAPDATILGVRVLDETGAGVDSDIIDGLNFIADWYKKHDKPPSVVSMSLGGDCFSTLECQDDPLVMAVEKLVDLGINVVVAAGNSDCDACLQTPSFAPRAITVGASSKTDDGAAFSDFGKCLDVYAPGVDILSACPGGVCRKTSDGYIPLSGTSMATPFVAGALTHFMQMSPSASASEIRDNLVCKSAKDALVIPTNNAQASITRNTLLQVPRHEDGDEGGVLGCDLGTGCLDECNGHGFCQHNVCLCDTIYYGRSCHSKVFGEHCSKNEVFVPFSLEDKDGSGWEGAEFSLVRIAEDGHQGDSGDDKSHAETTILTTSMCMGTYEESGACFVPGKRYELRARSGTAGGADKSWNMCGTRGGVPFRANFTANSHGECSVTCESDRETQAASIAVTMHSGRGKSGWWSGKHYSIILGHSGLAVGGGSMMGTTVGGSKAKNYEKHSVCIRSKQDEGAEPTLFALLLAAPRPALLSQQEVMAEADSWTVCGVTRNVDTDFALFEYNWSDGSCRLLEDDVLILSSDGESVHSPHDLQRALRGLSEDDRSPLPLGLFDLSREGWQTIGESASQARLTVNEVKSGDSGVGAELVSVQLQGKAAAGQLSLPITTQTWGQVGAFWVSGQPSDDDASVSDGGKAVSGSDPINKKFWVTCGTSDEVGSAVKFRTGTEGRRGIWNCHRDCLDATRIPDDVEDTLGYKMQPEMKDFVVNSTTDMGLMWVTLIDEKNTLVGLKRLGTLDESINSVCLANSTSLTTAASLAEPLCMQFFLGGGTVLALPEWEFCGQRLPAVSSMVACVHDWSECSAMKAATPDCSAGMLRPSDGTILSSSPISMVLISGTGNGWHGAEFIVTDDDIDFETEMGNELVRGTLDEGMIDHADLCLADGCYMVYVTPGKEPEAIEWVMCGSIFAADMGAVLKIENGRCLLYTDVFECQNPGYLAKTLRNFMYRLRVVILALVVVGTYFLANLCFKLPEDVPTDAAHVAAASEASNAVAMRSWNESMSVFNLFRRVLDRLGFGRPYAALPESDMEMSRHGPSPDTPGQRIEMSPMHST